MGKAARAHAQLRRQRRERLARKFPIVDRMLSNHTVARMFVETAPFARVLIAQGLSPTPDLGVENHDAMVSLIKDGLGLVTLSDAEFECAVRLATPPECQETVH